MGRFTNIHKPVLIREWLHTFYKHNNYLNIAIALVYNSNR